MDARKFIPIVLCIVLAGCAPKSQALLIGESFTIASRVMNEARRVNVFRPTVYGQPIDGPTPVLYMLDGGLDEDFLHVAGLVQVLVSNGGMRPHLLVGIPNTQRRRDMTGPTQNPEDRKIAPVVGGSAAFRRFIKEELMPEVRSRYRTTDAAAVVGESLAGLFVVETLLRDPDLFQTYIAFDPSLWWNGEELLKAASAGSAAAAAGRRSVFLAHSSEPTLARVTAAMARELEGPRGAGLSVRCVPMTEETHATLYHPAALRAFRTVLGP